MKKPLLVFLFFVLFIITIASAKAIVMPLPIAGKLIGEGAEGVSVSVLNERTKEELRTEANIEGEWLIDWSNAKEPARRNDVFNISVGDVFERVVYETQSIIYVEIGYEEEKVCVCDCSNWQNIGVGAAIGLILGLVAFMGGGLQIYKNRKGEAIVRHRHKGIKGYHDPNVKHRDPKYSHRRLRDDAKGFLKDVKKIEEEGGLI